MRKKAIILMLCTMGCMTIPKAAAAGIGTWNAYMAYHDIQQIREASGHLFVLASNSLYQYNLSDQSITTYDKVNGLSDTYITNIVWNADARRLIAVYENSNIDLVDTRGNVTNISDLYNKAMTEDKTVNTVTISGKYAYLATNFGIVKVNMSAAEISETYNLGLTVRKVAISGNRIYARTKQEAVWSADINANLLDKSNWTVTSSWPQGIFDEDKTEYDKYYPIVETLEPGGPDYNYFGFLKFHKGRLYSTNGRSGQEDKACLQVYDGIGWNVYENDIEERTGHRFVNLYCCDIDPADESHVFAGGQTGLYEFKDSKFVKEYNLDNSPLKEAVTVSAGNKNYVLVTGVKFDNNRNLWVTNSISPSTSLLELKRDGTWESHHDSRLMITAHDTPCSMEGLESIMFDSRGLMWFSNNFWNSPALIKYNISTNAMAVEKDFENQDGISFTMSFVRSVKEDRDGNIWMGTNVGPVYVAAAQITGGNSHYTYVQPKIPRNDGTNYADYLLNNIETTAVAIDGANRKWFGTSGNGVYLISADNMTEIHHFTTKNSKLLSDNIRDIAVNDQTGEVFFGTDKGLCSYMSDATAPAEEMDKDNVYAYPNPVEPGYTGLITVTGLTFDADVKITTATGFLVAEGRSNGGTFTWNGTDRNGNRVASGVYNVMTAKSDGSKGTVCKIAIIN